MSTVSTASPTAPMAFVANVVQLVNEGEKTFSMKYGPRDRLVLEPGQSYFVQEEVAWQFLGRWWTTNADQRNRERVNEYNRLRVLYGAYEDDVLWEQNRPQIVAYMANGDRITSVVDDPEGTNGLQAQTQFGREQSLEAQMAIMQQTILTMQAQIESRDRVAAEAGVPDAPADVASGPVPVPTYVAPAPPTAPMGMVAGQVLPVAPPAVTPSPQRVMPPSASGVTYDAQGRPRGAERVAPKVEGDAIVGLEVPIKEATAYDPEKAFQAMSPEEQARIRQARIDAGIEVAEGDVPVDVPARIPTGSRIPAGRPAGE